MPKRKRAIIEPAEFELQILAVLWDGGPATVRQVIQRLTDGKERAYTSVLSVMQVMHKKGLLEISDERDGLAHIYRPAVTREEVAGPRIRTLVSRIFGGSPRLALQHLLSADPVSPAEINAMRKLLDDLQQSQQDSSSPQ